MKHCKALNRGTNPQECRRGQRELPPKFCQDCSWFKNLYILRKKFLRGENKGTKNREYKIRIPGYVRNFLLVASTKEGINVNQLIINILRREALNK